MVNYKFIGFFITYKILNLCTDSFQHSFVSEFIRKIGFQLKKNMYMNDMPSNIQVKINFIEIQKETATYSQTLNNHDSKSVL